MPSTAEKVQQYVRSKRARIVTARFNESTWQENADYRVKHPNIGCIYPSPRPIQADIQYDCLLIMLEMRNDKNQIGGISMLKNRANINDKYHVYKDAKYNQYAYLGNVRIDRKDMTEQEEQIMKVFDILCFKGHDHLKRLKGIMAFPSYKLYCCAMSPTGKDLVDFLYSMFTSRKNRIPNPNQNPNPNPNI